MFHFMNFREGNMSCEIKNPNSAATTAELGLYLKN